MNKALRSAKITLRVPFHDVDSMRICWHGNYYKYFEMARTELLRPLKMDLSDTLLEDIVLPVIRSQCKYISPLLYDQKVEVLAQITDAEYKLFVNYVIRDEATGAVLAKGSTEHVAVNSKTGVTCMPMPQEFLRRICGEG
ncbi:MAG TPA: thioesterase family protein [Fibrobacteraceae bacterium]|nr:thioesterase family protein [Fibrobacteraceae bacterium]